ncbi:hypothetical protein LTS18_012562, partial [Coniosporium uncinatum]
YYRLPDLGTISTTANDAPDIASKYLSSCLSGASGIKLPHSSSDTALTAFAQLGALRMDCRRCMISFFDRERQYILAEATRTLSLQTHTAENEEDAIAWGATILPSGGGICKTTVALPFMWEGSGEDVTAFV